MQKNILRGGGRKKGLMERGPNRERKRALQRAKPQAEGRDVSKRWNSKGGGWLSKAGKGGRFFVHEGGAADVGAGGRK